MHRGCIYKFKPTENEMHWQNYLHGRHGYSFHDFGKYFSENVHYYC